MTRVTTVVAEKPRVSPTRNAAARLLQENCETRQFRNGNFIRRFILIAQRALLRVTLP